MADPRLRFKLHLYADHPEHACLMHFLRQQGGAELLPDAAQQRELKRLIRIGFELPPAYSLMPGVRIPSLTPPTLSDQVFVVSFRSEKDAALGGYLRFSPGTYAFRAPAATSALARDLAIAGFRAICARDMTLAMIYGYTTAFGMPPMVQQPAAPHPFVPPPAVNAHAPKKNSAKSKPAPAKKTVPNEVPAKAPIAATEVAPKAPPKPQPVTEADITSDDFDPMDFL